MTDPALHIVFNMSAAFDLRKALAQVGRHDQVVALCDDLSFGPINPPDPDLRTRWVETELGYSDWEDIGNEAGAFWVAALSDATRRIAWMSRRSTSEYAGFLEFVWRLGRLPCEVIDLTEVTVIGRDKNGEPSSPRLAGSLALLPAHQIIENYLLDQTQGLTTEMREAYRIAWGTLRTENAALRVLDADLELRSAPISFFDQNLLSCAKRDWMKAAKLIGEVLAGFWNDVRYQTGDIVLASRLRTLVAAGLLEAKGDLSQNLFAEVRLPTPQE